MDRQNETYLTDVYERCLSAMKGSVTQQQYRDTAAAFDRIAHFRDAAALRDACLQRAEILRKDSIYQDALKDSESGFVTTLEKAAAAFDSIPDWEDAPDRAKACRDRIAAIFQAEAQQAEAERLEEEARKAKNRRIAAIFSAALAAAVGLSLLIAFVILPACRYGRAQNLTRKQQYAAAYDIFWALGEYRDAQTQAEAIQSAAFSQRLAAAAPGDTLFFGSYEQDGNTLNGPEPVEWIVLEKQGDRALLLSKYCLDYRSYNSESFDPDWAASTLRPWMNGEFLNALFTPAMQSLILPTAPDADETDMLFLLSAEEATHYFPDPADRGAGTTYYGRTQSSYVPTADGNTWWWLRSANADRSSIHCVDYFGEIFDYGMNADNHLVGVRPALWLEP